MFVRRDGVSGRVTFRSAGCFITAWHLGSRATSYDEPNSRPMDLKSSKVRKKQNNNNNNSNNETVVLSGSCCCYTASRL